MFALLGRSNHVDRRHRFRGRAWAGGEGGGPTLVSSTGQSASAIYLTTLATPALLLREAGVETLRTALGLCQGVPSPPSPAAPPEREGSADWTRSLSLLSELMGEEDEQEEEADPQRGLPSHCRANSGPCDCTHYAPKESFGAAI
ncbi:hypothetical protein GJAV_G00190280 [Gymnothorax javanicus]|nr:hypothetical protein GJAV_G00190280 [Gymnothorax javanicus]